MAYEKYDIASFFHHAASCTGFFSSVGTFAVLAAIGFPALQALGVALCVYLFGWLVCEIVALATGGVEFTARALTGSL